MKLEHTDRDSLNQEIFESVTLDELSIMPVIRFLLQAICVELLAQNVSRVG